MKRQPFVLIEILNWNKAEMTIECIKSVIKNTNYNNYKIAVIDNGSTDGSVEKIRKKFGKEVYITHLDKNYGFAVGYNKGNNILLKRFNPDYILLMNNDIIVPNNQKNWLKKLVDTFNKFPNAGTIGCRLVYPDGRIQHSGVTLTVSESHPILKHKIWIQNKKNNDRSTHEENIVTGALMLIPKEIWIELNGFDEIFSPMDCEDIDFCLRMKKIGKKCIYNGGVELIHLEGFSRRLNKKLISRELISKIKARIIGHSHEYIILLRYGITKNKLSDLVISILTFPCFNKDSLLRCLVLTPFRILFYNIVAFFVSCYKIMLNVTKD